MSRNQEILEGLKRAEAEGRLPHALILSGPASEAKLACVEELAAYLFSRGDRSAEQVRQRIHARNHPDFTRIDPVEGKVGVDEVRELPKLLAFPPLEAAKRIVLLSDAAALNAQAFNSILKVLEEPPHHTMFFLLCRDPGELLQTIVSRCQILRFAPLSDAEIQKSLAGKLGTDPEAVLAWAEGSLERAETLIGEEEGLNLRREACERLLEMWEASPRIPARGAQWVEKIEGEAHTAIVLDTWELLLRDFAYAAAGAAAHDLRFRDLYTRLRDISAKGGEAALEEVARKASAINRFRVYRELNGNLRLDFAALLTDLQLFSVGNSRASA
jgi:DNA polymerase III subunit delta'